ncbi:MAG: hypothetical protein KatS3mg120_0033 [Erythrobacter sp.]|nr:MAG: hypothetical protein KatS3mg120_0033 [Erythrobacter sp.]
MPQGGSPFPADLDGPASAGAKVRFSLPELGRNWSATADAEGHVTGTIPLPRTARLWSPESPQLYNLTLAVGADSVTDRIGFRSIERRGNALFLNDKPLTLLGVSIHEEAIGAQPTRVLDEAAARALLSEAKALGSNFVRLAHYPHTETMVRLADEMGLLVWSEIPVYWDIAFDSEATYAEASAMLRAMIARDMNRPSVVIWSVANETPINDSRNRFLQRLIAEARTADPSRLISAAMDKMPEAGGLDDGNLILVNDPLAEHLDVLAINRYDGWYGPLTPARGGRGAVGDAVRQADHPQRIRRGRAARLPRRSISALERGLSGGNLSPICRHDSPHPELCRDVAVDIEGFPLSPAVSRTVSGLLEPQGPD